MKKYLTILTLLLTAWRVEAQDTCFPFNGGGFGHFYTGPTYFASGELRDYLEQPAVLGNTLPVRVGAMTGGEGACLLGRFILGGGGFGVNMLRHTTDSSRLEMNFGGGYFKFGYACWYSHLNFGFAYAGVGWGAMSVHLENISSEQDIRFNRLSPLTPGHKQDYELSHTFYDFGLSYKHLFVSDYDSGGKGGFLIGCDLGLMITQPTGEWGSDDNEVISGPPVPLLNANPYFRITIGGGGFGLK